MRPRKRGKRRAKKINGEYFFFFSGSYTSTGAHVIDGKGLGFYEGVDAVRGVLPNGPSLDKIVDSAHKLSSGLFTDHELYT